METLVVVAQHRNQYYGRVKSHGSVARFGSNSPSSNFRGINCRTFQSGAGLLPTPFQASPTLETKQSPVSLFSSKTPTPAENIPFNGVVKSSPIPINVKVPKQESPFGEEFGVLSENLSFNERWAGPAYSNSPPPSSLPIPKFSMRPKRTVSLNLPASDVSGIELLPTARSAPASPTREHNQSVRDMFLSPDSATKTLRRILNLDVEDE